MAEAPSISVIVPVCNEQDTVADLCAALERVISEPYEVIFIDDGSRDDTWARLREIHRPGSVRLLRFQRKFGKTAALMAGFAASRGEIVFTMDGDLQDDPAEIPRFLSKLEEGYDLVVGWKKTRHDPVTKVIASRLFNFVVRKATGVALHDMNCGFKAYRGEMARSVRLHGEMHRFVPALLAAEGRRVTEIVVTHHPRKHGKSKYGFSRVFKGFFDLVTVLLVTRFRGRPAHVFGAAGVVCLALSLVLIGVKLWLTDLDSRALSHVAAAYLGFLAILLGAAAVVLPAVGWLGELLISTGAEGPRGASYRVEEQLD